MRRHNDHKAFEAIAQQGQNGGGFFAAAQNVGCARVFGAVGSGVGEFKKFAHQDGKGDGADQISKQQKKCGGHRVQNPKVRRLLSYQTAQNKRCFKKNRQAIFAKKQKTLICGFQKSRKIRENAVFYF